MPKMVSSESESVIKVFMQEIAKERQAGLNQVFSVGSLLIVVFMVSALITMLAYQYFSKRMNLLHLNQP